MKNTITVSKEYTTELLEYLETCIVFENNLDKEIQTQYQKYQDIKKDFIEYLNKPQMELLDEIMKNFITIQILAKYPRPKSLNEEINRTHYYRQRPYWIHQAFQKIKTKQGEIMIFYLRSNEFYKWCQDKDVYYKPLENMLKYVMGEYKNWNNKTKDKIGLLKESVMEQETYLDLSQEQEAYLLNNCDLLDYIYNLQLIEDEKYEMLLKIKKVFQKQISIIQAINYDVIKTNRSNKSNDGNISNIVDRNRNYMKIERLINNRETKELLEKTLFANHKTIVILETLDNDKDKLIELIINICDIIDELYNLIYNSSDYERRIKRLKEKIMEFGGIKKLSRKLKISKNTIKKILRGEVNFKYEFLERMERFLNNGFKK